MVYYYLSEVDPIWLGKKEASLSTKIGHLAFFCVLTVIVIQIMEVSSTFVLSTN